MKKLVAAAALSLLMVLSLAGGAGATHTEGPPECVTVVVEEAWTETIEHPATQDGWQRYSLVGGSWKSDATPLFPDPGGKFRWQANVAGDPHGVGVEGAYWRSNESSGKTDWFYLEAVPGQEAWTETIEHDEVTEEECHDASSSPKPPPVCEGGFCEGESWTPSWTPSDGGVPPVGESPRENLAKTGGDVTVPAIAGGALLATGLGALYLARRRRMA